MVARAAIGAAGECMKVANELTDLMIACYGVSANALSRFVSRVTVLTHCVYCGLLSPSQLSTKRTLQIATGKKQNVGYAIAGAIE